MTTRRKERELQEIISQIREKEFAYAPREEKKINWRAYGKAQYREIAEMLDFIREIVNAAEERISARTPQKRVKPVGRPCEIPASDVLKVLLMQTYFGESNRVAEGLQILFSDRLGLRMEFSYKKIERGFDDGDVRELMDEARLLTNEPVKNLEKIFSVDGTGHPVSNKQNYAFDRNKQTQIKQNKAVGVQLGITDAFPASEKPYVSSVGVIGVKYKLYASWSSTTRKDIGERSMFDEVFEDALELHPQMQYLLGDGLYANRPTCKTVGGAGVTPVFLPARNATMQKKGVNYWVVMLTWLHDHPQEFLCVYHERSISETGNSMDKRAFPKPVYKRLAARKETAVGLRHLVHNIKQLVYIKFLCEEVNVTFSNHAK